MYTKQPKYFVWNHWMCTESHRKWPNVRNYLLIVRTDQSVIWNSIFVENSPYEMMHLQMSSQHRKKALKFFFMLQSAWWTNFFKEKKKSSHKGRHVDFTFFTNLEISAVLVCQKKHWCSRDCFRHLLTLCHEQETAS